MVDTVLLTIGLVGLVGGLALVAGLVLDGRSTRAAVARSLATVEAMTSGARGDASPAVSMPLADRLMDPVSAQMEGLGRRLADRRSTPRLQRLLDLAGNPGSWTVEKVYAYKGLGLIALGAMGAVWGSSRGALVLGLTASVAAAVGSFLPDVLLYNAGVRRQTLIQKGLPDCLDMLTICVEAGLGFDAALAQVARNTEGPLAADFFRVLQEMQIGKSRLEAFRALGERTTVPELRQFVAALVQADSLGIPIAHVLRSQAKEMRVKRMQRAEEQAQKVPVKIMVPLILFILPCLLIVVIGPGIVSIIHSFSGVNG